MLNYCMHVHWTIASHARIYVGIVAFFVITCAYARAEQGDLDTLSEQSRVYHEEYRYSFKGEFHDSDAPEPIRAGGMSTTWLIERHRITTDGGTMIAGRILLFEKNAWTSGNSYHTSTNEEWSLNETPFHCEISSETAVKVYQPREDEHASCVRSIYQEGGLWADALSNIVLAPRVRTGESMLLVGARIPYREFSKVRMSVDSLFLSKAESSEGHESIFGWFNGPSDELHTTADYHVVYEVEIDATSGEVIRGSLQVKCRQPVIADDLVGFTPFKFKLIAEQSVDFSFEGTTDR